MQSNDDKTTSGRRYTGRPTRELYPDESLPGYLRKLRESGTREQATAARLGGAERRTVDIAKERLDELDELERAPAGDGVSIVAPRGMRDY